MPLSKPVDKERLILPSPREFHQLPAKEKELILKQLSTDNLIVYLEYIVEGLHGPSQNEPCILDQVIEVSNTNATIGKTRFALPANLIDAKADHGPGAANKPNGPELFYPVGHCHMGNNDQQFKAANERPVSVRNLRSGVDNSTSFRPPFAPSTSNHS